MTTLLHISASPRGASAPSPSPSRRPSSTTYARANPDVTIEHWDLWDGTLPEFGPPAAAGKMTIFAGADPEGDAATAWRQVAATLRAFDSADHYLFTVPMWNASVPYMLKQLIDVISQPGMVFGFDPVTGYTGLLTGRKAAVLYTARRLRPRPRPRLRRGLPGALLPRLAGLGGCHRRLRGRLPSQHRHRRRRRAAGDRPPRDPPAGQGVLTLLPAAAYQRTNTRQLGSPAVLTGRGPRLAVGRSQQAPRSAA